MFKSARFCQLLLCLSLLSLAEFDAAIALAQSPHNVILFIPDGLRPESVNPTIAPTFARVRDQGVRFANSHSIFPTLTMVNSAAMGTSQPGPGSLCDQSTKSIRRSSAFCRHQRNAPPTKPMSTPATIAVTQTCTEPRMESSG